MAMALQGVRDYLRQKCDWNAKQCGVQEGGIPPPTAGEFYIAVDESNVTGTDPRNYYASEEFEISVYVLRRVGRYPKDFQGKMLLSDDTYLATIDTLEKLERKVYVTLDQKWGLPTYINSFFGLPHQIKGDKFLKPLNYLGRGRTTGVAIPEGGEQEVFDGREMRFRGLKRNQHIGSEG